MFTRIFIVIAGLSLVSGCIATPRIEITQRINFDYTPPNIQPMSSEDLMCCNDCQA